MKKILAIALALAGLATAAQAKVFEGAYTASYLTGPNHVFEGSVCVVFTHTGNVLGFADSGVWGANSFGEGGDFIVDQGQLRFYGPYTGSQYIVNHYLPVPDKFSTGIFDKWIDTAPLTPVQDGNVVLSKGCAGG
jgi:hypothetical protein